MSLSALVDDDWLKPVVDDGPDLGGLASEDIKWDDLAFLDLATSQPQHSTHHVSKNKNNPVSGYNFPDIFFDSSGFFDGDENRFLGDNDFEKGFLADLFPTTTPANEEENEKLLEDLIVPAPEASEPPKTTEVASSATSSFTSVLETRPSSLRVSEIRTLPSGDNDVPPKGAVAKIAIRQDRKNKSTLISILSPDGSTGRSYQVNTLNLYDAIEALKPLNLDKSSFIKGNIASSENQKPTPSTSVNSDIVELDINDNHNSVVVEKIEDSSTKEFMLNFRLKGIQIDSLYRVNSPGQPRYWICPKKDCRKGFSKLSLLKVHLYEHYDIRPFQCTHPGCSWSFRTAFKLKRHSETHEKDESKRKKFLCNVCDSGFSTAYNLGLHLKLHDRPSKFVCNLCNPEEKFFNKKSLECHKKNKHSGETRNKKSTSLLRAKKENHEENGFRCSHEGCGKTFGKAFLLEAHFRIHTGVKPYVCNFDKCTWAFRTASKLRRHERTHKNERAFVCGTCSKSYLRAEHLRAHMSAAHREEKRNFVCPHDGCDVKFTAQSSLYVHVKNRHSKASNGRSNNGIDRLRCFVESCPSMHENYRELTQHVASQHSNVVDPNRVDLTALLSSVDEDEVRLEPTAEYTLAETPIIYATEYQEPVQTVIVEDASNIPKVIQIPEDRLSTVDATAITRSTITTYSLHSPVINPPVEVSFEKPKNRRKQTLTERKDGVASPPLMVNPPIVAESTINYEDLVC